MNDPRDPDARDGAPTTADDAPALVPEAAPVGTSAAVGPDAAAAREAAAHYYAKGEAHFERREWAEALKAYRTAAGADPKMSVAWYYISAAEREMNGRKPCDAEYLPLMHCIRLDPNHARAHCGLGNVQMHVRKDPAKAEESFREAIRLDPKWAPPHWNYSYLLEQQGDWTGAIREMRECVQAGADAEELC